MTFVLTFKVDVAPIPKGRPRFARRGGFVSTYTDKKTLDYEKIISDHARLAMGSSEPLEGPIDAFIYFSMPIPVSYSKKRAEACKQGIERPMKMDIDNQVKAIFDGMNGIVYKDDSQIVSLHATKVYGEPSVEIMVRETECLTLR
jgi:Holliday junction resolvase RusA-like endonuclease